MLELVIALVLAALVISVMIVAYLSTMNRSRARGAVHEIQSLTQLARMEAVSRSRECRVLLSPDLRKVMVTDGWGTVSADDDIVLHQATLPPSVSFTRPDAGAAINWNSLGGSPPWFGLRFAADGTVVEGESDIFLKGAEHYGRLSVFVSGGTRISTWRDGAWRTGSY
jgi:Tfp pilus assembly protein FimT